MEVNGQLHGPAVYPQEKRPWYQLDRRLAKFGTEAGMTQWCIAELRYG
jgi:hypothetical protein